MVNEPDDTVTHGMRSDLPSEPPAQPSRGSMPPVDLSKLINPPPLVPLWRKAAVPVTVLGTATAAFLLGRGCAPETPIPNAPNAPQVVQDPMALDKALKETLRLQAELKKQQQQIAELRFDVQNERNQNDAALRAKRNEIQKLQQELAPLLTEKLQSNLKSMLNAKEKKMPAVKSPLGDALENALDWFVGGPLFVEEMRKGFDNAVPVLQRMDKELKIRPPMADMAEAIRKSLEGAEERKKLKQPIFNRAAKNNLEQLARKLIEIGDSDIAVNGVPRAEWGKLDVDQRLRAQQDYNELLSTTGVGLGAQRAEQERKQREADRMGK